MFLDRPLRQSRRRVVRDLSCSTSTFLSSTIFDDIGRAVDYVAALNHSMNGKDTFSNLLRTSAYMCLYLDHLSLVPATAQEAGMAEAYKASLLHALAPLPAAPPVASGVASSA